MNPPRRETKMPNTDFLTVEFFREHGHNPIGEGFWIFCTPQDWSSYPVIRNSFYFVGDYSDAKKAAMQHYPAGSRVVVMP